jgi:hypothetical protein
MGRYYYGDITGKLWLSVQSSDDADNYGVKGYYEEEYVCENCGDSCDIKEDIKTYDINGCCESDDKKHSWIIEECESSIEYHFQPRDLTIVTEQLTKFKTELKEIMKCSDRAFRHIIRELSKGDDNYSDYFKDTIDSASVEEKELLARVELGYKIYNCLIKNPSCYFSCEC